MTRCAWLQGGVCCVLALSIITVTGAYLPYHDKGYSGHKTNDVHHTPVKRYGPSFKSDTSIQKYLRMFGMKVMLWRCKNAIQPYWNSKPIDTVELYCETIGSIKNIEWFHNADLLDIKNRSPDRHYYSLAFPHYAHGHFYSGWIDFKLLIVNATSADTGMYTFRVTGTDDKSDEQIIYVDISEKKRKKKSSKRKKYAVRWDGEKLERKSKKLRKRADRRRRRKRT